MDWKDSSGSSTSYASWMLSVSSVANDSSSVGTFMGCAPKGGAISRLQLIPISLIVTFSTVCTPRKVREKSDVFLLTHEHKIYITEYTQHVLGEREKEREGERKKSF